MKLDEGLPWFRPDISVPWSCIFCVHSSCIIGDDSGLYTGSLATVVVACL